MGRGAVQSLVLSQLGAGAHLVIRTTNSSYDFWMEYPDQAIGVLRGGSTPSPTRVRLAAESAASNDASATPLRVGERARVVVLGPNGAPVRGFVTSTIARIVVDSPHRVAA